MPEFYCPRCFGSLTKRRSEKIGEIWRCINLRREYNEFSNNEVPRLPPSFGSPTSNPFKKRSIPNILAMPCGTIAPSQLHFFSVFGLTTKADTPGIPNTLSKYASVSRFWTQRPIGHSTKEKIESSSPRTGS
jgi:hypothetical protein